MPDSSSTLGTRTGVSSMSLWNCIRYLKYFRPSVELPHEQDGLIEKWICYGNEYITAKEVTVIPGHEVLLKDQAAYGCIIIQGYGTFGPYQAEAVNMMRVGSKTADEYFVSRRRANNGVRIANNGLAEPMVILQHFGPDHAVFI